MDLLRSCYECDMLLYRDDPTRLTRVRWYFVSADHEWYSHGTPFRSRVWEIEDEVPPTLGERWENRKWSGGLPLKPVSRGGHCGTMEQWYRGCDEDDPIGPNYPNTGVPVCCNAPIEQAKAVIGVGVSGDQPDCCLPDEAPDNLHISFSLIAGDPCTEVTSQVIFLPRQTACTTKKFWLSDLIFWSGFPGLHFGRLAIYCDGFDYIGVWGQEITTAPCFWFGTTFTFDKPLSCEPFWMQGTLALQCPGGSGSLLRVTITR